MTRSCVNLTQESQAGTHGQNLEEGTDAEIMEEHYLLARPSLLPLSQCSDTIQGHVPRGGTIHSGLGTPASITNQENDPQTCTEASQIKAISQMRSRLAILDCVKLTAETKRQFNIRYILKKPP